MREGWYGRLHGKTSQEIRAGEDNLEVDEIGSKVWRS
jgi:hypothetical protein